MRSWKDYVIRWRKLYGQPSPKVYNPCGVKVSPLRCGKCSSTWKVTRHHKGHEFYLAVVDEATYAARYIQFRPEDIVPLCGRCHDKVHRLYMPIMSELRMYIEACFKCLDANDNPVWEYKPSVAVLESYRKRMISKCDRWLKGKIKKPTHSRKKKLSRKRKVQNENTKFNRFSH